MKNEASYNSLTPFAPSCCLCFCCIFLFYIPTRYYYCHLFVKQHINIKVYVPGYMYMYILNTHTHFKCSLFFPAVLFYVGPFYFNLKEFLLVFPKVCWGSVFLFFIYLYLIIFKLIPIFC